MFNAFKAPQKSLKSSWSCEIFAKPKKRGVITVSSSRNGRPFTTVKQRGSYTKASKIDIY